MSIFNAYLSKTGEVESLIFPISLQEVSITNDTQVNIKQIQSIQNKNSIQSNSNNVKGNISIKSVTNNTNQVNDIEGPVTKSYNKDTAYLQNIDILTKDGIETSLTSDKNNNLKRKEVTEFEDFIETIYLRKNSEVAKKDLNTALSEDIIASVYTYIDEDGNTFYSEKFMDEEIYLGE